MNSMVLVRRVVLIMLALFCFGSITACGAGKKEDPKFAKVKAGDMPEGGDWTGVYFDPLYGYLHLTKEGTAISGAWRTEDGSAWGEMNGTVTGDLFKFEWSENKIGLVGPSAKSNGRGYFKYVVPEGENVNHEIVGEWGLDDREVGNEWKAVKQRNMAPDLASVRPTPEEGQVEGGNFDQGGGGDDDDDDDDDDTDM